MIGLDIILSPNVNDYYSYVRPTYGIEVIIHPRSDFPYMRNQVTLLPGYEMKVSVLPSILQPDEPVRFFLIIFINQYPF